ncbi:hypothetical protein [Paenibacillus sp. MZ03-122A]|uniref:hypothetical protein n=1 Tax=Paenibacillus sp. MZ03-122A TaxID=2962033 RepID=UPI0020B6B802|nr:hypothetical protein [Paenibacillus sp. MZ03-122A]
MFVEFVALIFLSDLKKVMQEKKLFQRYTMQGLLDELDVIECYQRPGHDLQFGEIKKRQLELYTALDVPLQPRYNLAGNLVVCKIKRKHSLPEPM